MPVIILTLVFLGFLWWMLSRGGQRNSSSTLPAYLMKRLDRLTHDRRASERLVQKISFKYPGRSQRWCLEKAIFDIELTRHRS